MAASFVYSPFGTLQLIANDSALVNIFFTHQFIEDHSLANDITRLTALQLSEYFEGNRKLSIFHLHQKGLNFN
jgi:hypothetical protein